LEADEVIENFHNHFDS